MHDNIHNSIYDLGKDEAENKDYQGEGDKEQQARKIVKGHPGKSGHYEVEDLVVDQEHAVGIFPDKENTLFHRSVFHDHRGDIAEHDKDQH